MEEIRTDNGGLSIPLGEPSIGSTLFGQIKSSQSSSDVRPEIVLNPQVCGGDPIISGSRITVSHIWELSSQLGWSTDRICRAYPHLSIEQVLEALKYAVDNPYVRVPSDEGMDA